MKKFQYVKPSTLDEVADILLKYGEEARILNGGTDLLVRMRDKMITPGVVVDIKAIPELKELKYTKEEGLYIGAAVTMNEVICSKIVLERYRILAEAAHEVGSYQLRNRATLTGNVCNASPSGDTIAPLYVLSANVKIFSKDGIRLVPIDEFILGVRKIALNPGEIVMGLQIPDIKGKNGGAYYKHARRKDVDLATVGVAAFCNEGKWKIAYAAVAPKILRGYKAEELLNNMEKIDEEALIPVMDAAVSEISPISDVRASKEYRVDMIKISLKRAVLAALEQYELGQEGII
ncbi:FAD binding domain-containing protein [Lutispora sp.]|uniref:FAD binding domain-containing protein n=1 Tax=Lutispora sp. TaxID=2828727 RepID=UPI0035671C38